MAGLDVVSGYSDEEIDRIMDNIPCEIAQFTSKEEANVGAVKVRKWFISVDIFDGSKNIVHVDESVILCPNCGSEKIQFVPRKWSILAGIYTNKVDRVCIKCKHKF